MIQLLLLCALLAEVPVEAGKAGWRAGIVQQSQTPAADVVEPVEDLLQEDDCVVESDVLVGPHGALSHTKVASIDMPGNLNQDDKLKIVLAESLKKHQALQQARREAESHLQESLASYEKGAKLNLETPGDGHCLFWALQEGGLITPSDMGDVRLTIQELRSIALSEATQEELSLAALGTEDEHGQPMSVEQYIAGMRQGLWGDMLMISCLARAFNLDITVISENHARTFGAAGGDFDGVMDTAIWVAHRGEEHYYGIKRAGQAVVEDQARDEQGACDSCGWFLIGSGKCLNPDCETNKKPDAYIDEGKKLDKPASANKPNCEGKKLEKSASANKPNCPLQKEASKKQGGRGSSTDVPWAPFYSYGPDGLKLDPKGGNCFRPLYKEMRYPQIMAMDDAACRELLLRYKLLPPMTSRHCYKCHQRGIKSAMKLVEKSGQEPRLRCEYWKCATHISAEKSYTPIFNTMNGWKDQASR